VSGIAGFTLAHSGADEFAGRDKLVGVLVTTEHLDLFDFESYLNDNAGKVFGELKPDGDFSKYQGRLYATLVERSLTNEYSGETFTTHEYDFEGVKGFPYFMYSYTDENGSYNGSTGDEAIADGHVSISETDSGESVSLEGTIYVAPSNDIVLFFVNPVCQTPDGRIYAVSGSGVSFESGGSGVAVSQTLNETTTVSKNGKAYTYNTSVKISFSEMPHPRRIALVQYNPDGQILSRDEYLPGTLPKSISPKPDCSYIILETYSTAPDSAETVARSLYQRSDGMLESFYRRDDGICIKQYTALDWGSQ